MTWLDALWLGLLQGLTEYLPVSSSGHLEIANTLLGIQGSDNLTFAVVVHAATVCSTLVVLWREIAGLFAGVFRFHWNEETQYVAKIFLSMIPVGIVGLFFKEEVESVFGNGLLVVGIMLLVTALLLTFAHYARPRRKEKISYKDAIIIGLAQACAVMPGTILRSAVLKVEATSSGYPKLLRASATGSFIRLIPSSRDVLNEPGRRSSTYISFCVSLKARDMSESWRIFLGYFGSNRRVWPPSTTVLPSPKARFTIPSSFFSLPIG